MDSINDNENGDAPVATTYDEYLGRFVDAVQHDSARYETLLATWTTDCPEDWRDRFATDTAEIAALIEAGAFGRTEDAA